MSASTLALKTFREEFVNSGLELDDFSSFDARRVRYAVNWSFYENDVYRHVNDWAVTYKQAYQLYKYIRNIYNPSYRLGEFYKTHLWGGALNADAEAKGALPIATENEALRPAIAQLWTWSNWSINKDIVTLKGSVLGDAIVRVIDDVEAGRVYLEYVNPSTVADLVVDVYGHVKGYTIKETRAHPDTGRDVEFREEVSRDGEFVVYKTFMNNAPYPWNGQAEEWAEAYGFVPMVHIEHNNVGLDWGWSEIQPARSKIHEVDDLASLLSDQARKSINAKWFFAGLKKGNDNETVVHSSDTLDAARMQRGREQEPALYSTDPNSKPYPMVAPLDIQGMVLHITEILKELERDYPELKFDNLRSSGTVSGASLRTARQPAETKVIQRRANYDNGLVRAQQMAVAIGGMRGYNGFQGFGLESYAAGALDHSIGDRPVFFIDRFEKLEEEKVFWEAAEIAVKAGYPLELYLTDAGWDEERIAKFAGSPIQKAKLALMQMGLT